jgi:hypothetical protein
MNTDTGSLRPGKIFIHFSQSLDYQRSMKYKPE